MVTSTLITGADKKIREAASLEKAGQVSSKFDIHIIDTEEEKGIAAVKEIIAKTSTQPFNSPFSSIIILEANNLTPEAQNALLKTLEEPNEKSQIILTAPDKTNLLPTVVSRCLEIPLKTEVKSNNLKEMNFSSFSDKLETMEKQSLDYLLSAYQIKLKESVNSNTENLTKLHRFEKLLLKMKTAEKSNVNKKLIALILALESPS